MAAKRVSGITPHHALLLRKACETCDKCEALPSVSRTVDGKIERRCPAHPRDSVNWTDTPTKPGTRTVAGWTY